jgi:SAM-dependent methyltransferase
MTSHNTPYAVLAPFYDATLGDEFFLRIRKVFERLVSGYGMRFTSVADVACGTGGFVRYLQQRGVPVVYGMDRSQAMLQLAIQRNRGNKARFFLQEFKSLQLPQPVDLITCNFDSLNYLLTTDELLQVLHRFHASLKPGGHIIFDMITKNPFLMDSLQSRVERVSLPFSSFGPRLGWDPRRCIQTIHLSIKHDGRTYREVHRQRCYPVATVIRLLTASRFVLLGVHDFQTLGPVTARTSRAVYVARPR